MRKAVQQVQLIPALSVPIPAKATRASEYLEDCYPKLPPAISLRACNTCDSIPSHLAGRAAEQ